MMYEIDKRILSTLESSEILEISTMMISQVSCDRATVALVDKERQGFVYAAGFGVKFVAKGDLCRLEIRQLQRLSGREDHSIIADLRSEREILPLERNSYWRKDFCHI